ncbi:MAG: MipA/OmpV family protein [Alphaproteobacteria bacterium]|nr:MipA/OmpV family protein [Alphaproteobacteria bacterium]
MAFLTTGGGLGVNLLHGWNYRAGVAVGYDVGRSQHAEQALNGTGSIPPAPVIRAFAEFFLLPFVVQGDVRRVIGVVDGLVGDLGVYVPVVGNRKLVVFVGPAVTLADDRYMQRYFGIGTIQASPNSRFPPYRAHAGFANANFDVSAIYHITEQWLIDADLGYERLLASAADSPIVQSKNQFGTSLTVAYEF